jgi:lambda repressor-like predicted transcriptional regulator
MLGSIKAEGGTVHGAAVRALYAAGVRMPKDEPLIVIVVGDEAGEHGRQLASTFRDCGYAPSALALVLNVAWRRGETVQQLARELGVPFSTITIEQFDDPYQVPRVLSALLEAPSLAGGPSFGLVEKVMKTKLLGVET